MGASVCRLPIGLITSGAKTNGGSEKKTGMKSLILPRAKLKIGRTSISRQSTNWRERRLTMAEDFDEIERTTPLPHGVMEHQRALLLIDKAFQIKVLYIFVASLGGLIYWTW